MNSDDMRALIKRICNVASKNASKAGHDIDFEKSLYITAISNGTWRMGIACDAVNNIADDEDDSICFGAKLSRYVPGIDRFQDIDHNVLMMSPVGVEYLKMPHYGRTVMLPLADEFAYKFPDKALEMILEKLMSREIYAYVDSPNKMNCKKLLDEENARFMASVEKMPTLVKKEFYKLSMELYKLSMEHDRRVADIHKMMKPVKIPIMPKACKSFEELGIVLDCYDI